MRGSFLILLFLFTYCFPVCAQVSKNPARFVYKAEEYFVYPVRGTNLNGIPPTGISLPDGKYILFTEFLLSSTGKLKDTTKVSAVFFMKENLPEGKAVFYQYDYRNANKLSGQHFAVTTGSYKRGMKDGEWVIAYEYGGKDIKNYKEGLLNGPAMEFTKKGKLIKKLKYRNERLYDTVYYYYPDGRLQVCYDVYDPLFETQPQPAENFYDRLLKSDYRLNVIGAENTVKSFYKEYSPEGKLKNSIRYTNGKNPVFDTLYFGNNEKLVVKNHAGDSIHRTVEFFGEFPLERTSVKKVFAYDEVISSTSITLNKKTKKTDTIISDFSFLEKINQASWKKTEAAFLKNGKNNTRCFLIPAVGFYWEEINGKRSAFEPVMVDSLNKTIVIRDTFRYLPQPIYRVREIRFKDTTVTQSVKTSLYEKFSMLPGMNEERIRNYFPDIVQYACKSIARTEIKRFCKDQLGKEADVRYLRNDSLLNEKIVFTSSKKLAGKMISGVKALFSDRVTPVAWVMELRNGKKNGKQEIAENMKVPVNTNNFVKIFFYYRKNGQRLTIAQYRDGVLNGQLNVYESKTYNTGKYNKDSTRVFFSKQQFAWCSTQQEYLNGKLHGTYKTFYETGKPHLIVQFAEGKINGKYENLNRDGSTAYSFFCGNDSLNGQYLAFHPTTHKNIHEAWFRNNKLDSFYVARSYSNDLPFLKLTLRDNAILKKALFYDNGPLKEKIICSTQSGTPFHIRYAGTETYISLKKTRNSFYGDEGLNADYKLFFENGKTACEGKIEKGIPAGEWKFYNTEGQLTNHVFFKDTILSFTKNMKPVRFAGQITSYFNDGKIRCKGFIKEWESTYDCNTRTDKIRFGIYYTDTWNKQGLKIVEGGNGKGIIYDENGIIVSEGEFRDYMEEGVWKYYDANGRLNETGTYVHGEKEGLWYAGDLENINFESGACFDMNSEYARHQYEYSKNTLKFSVEIYREGALISSEYYESNLNKEK